MACRFPGTNPERRGLTPTAQSAHPSFHVMAFRCQCIWKSIFSFLKSHRQMYWVAVPHMTSQLPEGNLMHVDEKLVISVIPPQQWCTHLKMHMIAMHALHKLLLLHYDLWASWHLTQFGRPHFLTRAFTNLCSSEPILFLADIDKVFRFSDFSSMPFHHIAPISLDI